jgi:large conductance mechanosensitive channel
MIKGFKDFLLRGNVVDLAVAVVVGVAFAALVAAVGAAILQPLIGLVLGGGVSGGQVDVNGQVFDFGLLINALIVFVITLAVLYFLVVVPVGKLMERRKRGQEPEVVATPEDIALLQEIRDLLREQRRP